MRLIELIASCIGKVWSFVFSLITICLVAVIMFFGITIFMPDNVVRAIEIFRSLTW
jgi:hypothetical protein